MSKLPLLPAALSLLIGSASACTVAGGEDDDVLEEGDVTLANPDDAGKADTVFGKTLRYNIRGEWTWTV